MESKFARRIDVLDEVFDFAERFFSSNQIDPATSYAIGVAIEEAFTNMVKYNPTGQGDLEVRLNREADRAIIGLTDFDSPQWDPLTAPEVDINAPIEQRSPGGLGIHLLRKLMDRMDYDYQDRRSTITFVKNIGGGMSKTE